MQVCRVFAENLLQSKPKWREADFLEAWQSSVPQVCNPLPADSGPLLLTRWGPGWVCTAYTPLRMQHQVQQQVQQYSLSTDNDSISLGQIYLGTLFQHR